MLGVALAGVAVNLAASWLLARANARRCRRSLNLEGAVAHVLTDLYAFAATVVAAIVVLASGFDRADPIATLVVVVLMLRAGRGADPQVGADLPRGGAGRARPGRARRRDGRPPARRRGPRPAHLGDHDRDAGRVGARAGRAAPGLPRGPGRPGGPAVARVRHQPPDPAGRPPARTPAPGEAPGPAAAGPASGRDEPAGQRAADRPTGTGTAAATCTARTRTARPTGRRDALRAGRQLPEAASEAAELR